MSEKIYTIAADEYNALARIKALLIGANVISTNSKDLVYWTKDGGIKMFEVTITLKEEIIEQ